MAPLPPASTALDPIGQAIKNRAVVVEEQALFLANHPEAASTPEYQALMAEATFAYEALLKIASRTVQ